MDKTQLDRIEEKQGVLAETQIRQQVTLEALTRSVEEHIRRTNLLELRVDTSDKKWVQTEMLLKILGVVGLAVPAITAMLRAAAYFLSR